MSSEERKKILEMVADGKINAEEAATLMRALEEPAEEEIQIIEAESGSGYEETDAPEFEEVRRRVSRFSVWFLGAGILITVLSAWIMFSVQQNSGLNFWFFCFAMPLILGIMFITLGAGNRTFRWLYVNVDRSQAEDWPKNILIAFPLPLGLAGWFIKNFGSYIDGFKKTSIDEIIAAINAAKSVREPLIIHVDESHNGGERVQVYIG